MKMFKKLFLLALLLLLFVSTASGTIIIRRSAASPDYSDILFWLGFEGSYSSPDYTMAGGECSSGDSTGDSYSTGIAIDGTYAQIGSYAIYNTTTADYLQFDISSDDIIDMTQGRLGFYLKDISMVDEVRFMTASGGDGYFQVKAYGTEEIQFQYGSSSAYSSGAGLGSTYKFIEVSWDTVADYYNIYVNGTLVGQSTTARDAITGVTALKISNYGATSGVIAIDNFMISDDPNRAFYTSGLYNDTSYPSGACP